MTSFSLKPVTWGIPKQLGSTNMAAITLFLSSNTLRQIINCHDLSGKPGNILRNWLADLPQ